MGETSIPSDDCLVRRAELTIFKIPLAASAIQAVSCTLAMHLDTPVKVDCDNAHELSKMQAPHLNGPATHPHLAHKDYALATLVRSHVLLFRAVSISPGVMDIRAGAKKSRKAKGMSDGWD
jgi:hypothetical protein